MASSPFKLKCKFVDAAAVRRRRLTKERCGVLASLSTPISQHSHGTDQSCSAFFDNVSRYPTAVQCKELADVVRQLPGCEWCTGSHVHGHMVNRRNKPSRRKASATKSRLHVQAEPSMSVGPTGVVQAAPAPEGSSSSAFSASCEVEEDDAVALAGMSARTPVHLPTESPRMPPQLDVITSPPRDLQGSFTHPTDASDSEIPSSELAPSTHFRELSAPLCSR